MENSGYLIWVNTETCVLTIKFSIGDEETTVIFDDMKQAKEFAEKLSYSIRVIERNSLIQP